MRQRTHALAACVLGALALVHGGRTAWAQAAAPIIVDHRATKLSDIPSSWITEAKSKLRIAYGHTSHGSQIVDGMSGLVGFRGSVYAWNGNGS